MGNQPTFFDFAAEVGLTKHIGGVAATDVLVELCHIGEGAYVLDVGCGVGVTPCYIAKRHGCHVVGVDISERMVERSRERARHEGVVGRVAFSVADARDLPFEDAVFDAVITESVTSFPEDKAKAVGEYVRVTRPGGYVGLNESVWRRIPPPPEVVAWASQAVGANVRPLTADAWAELLAGAGLCDIVVQSRAIDTQDEARGILQRYGVRGMIGVLARIVWLYVRSPYYRRFVQDVRKGDVMPEDLQEYFGYGLFVGRKTW